MPASAGLVGPTVSEGAAAGVRGCAGARGFLDQTARTPCGAPSARTVRSVSMSTSSDDRLSTASPTLSRRLRRPPAAPSVTTRPRLPAEPNGTPKVDDTHLYLVLRTRYLWWSGTGLNRPASPPPTSTTTGSLPMPAADGTLGIGHARRRSRLGGVTTGGAVECPAEDSTGSADARGGWLGDGTQALACPRRIEASRRVGSSPASPSRPGTAVAPVRAHPRGCLPAGPLVAACEREPPTDHPDRATGVRGSGCSGGQGSSGRQVTVFC